MSFGTNISQFRTDCRTLDEVRAVLQQIQTNIFQAFGDMVWQNHDAVNIDGGTIDGTTIGATSATTGVFTDLSVTGTTDLGNAVTDSITCTGRFDSGLTPIASATYSLGTSDLLWANSWVGTSYATTFDTNVAAAGVTLSGTTLQADGTDAAIDITLTPKGTGEVNISKVDIDAGTIDGTDITVGSGKTLNVSAGTLTLADNQIDIIYLGTSEVDPTKVLIPDAAGGVAWAAIGGVVGDIEDQSTSQTHAGLRMRPDGAGGVEWVQENDGWNTYLALIGAAGI